MPRVLLVDDEATFLQATADLLRAQGYECETAPDAATAAPILAGDPPVDVVVADVRMPGNAELELVRALDRSDGRRPVPPVILITGYPSLQTAVDAVALPVVAYLVKPFAFEELLREVGRAVDRGATRRALSQSRERLERWRDDVAELERAGAGDDTFVALTLRNVAASLVDLKRVVDGRSQDAGDPCQVLNCPRGLALGAALHEAVEVLDRTKHAFKSKELGDLRRKLEQLLRPLPR